MLSVAADSGSKFLIENPEVAPALPSANLSELGIYSEPIDSYSLAKGTPPAAYDSRTYGYVTSVKNQDPWGACWAFGALASGESGLIKKGLANSSIDLSEMHLAYFMYNTVTDPLGLTAGDKTTITAANTNYLDMGGNSVYTMFALAKWTGAAPEATMPYNVGFKSGYSSSLAYQSVARMQNARYVSNRDRTNMKRLIMEHGSVATSMYYNSMFQNATGGFYFPTGTFSGTFPSNHVVTVVGWNDAYPRANLKSTYQYRTITGAVATGTATPSRNGAWIVKNSYGTSEGDGGYIYISYEDISMQSTTGDFFTFAFDMEKADNYDYNYQYDGSTGSTTLKLKSGDSIAARYVIQGKGGREQLDAISFALDSENVKYSIQVYKNSSKKNPTDGTAMLKSAQTGSTTYCGYYTIPLRDKLVFEKGDVFTVVIRFTSSSGPEVHCFVDYSALHPGGIRFTSVTAKGQTFVKSGSNWRDTTSLSGASTASVRLKAFTNTTTAGATKVEPVTSTLKTPKVALKKKNYKSVQLTWKKIKNAKGYEIHRSTSKNSGYRRIATTNKLTYTDKKINVGTTYYYKVRAHRTMSSQKRFSLYSAVRSYKPKLNKPKLNNVSRKGRNATLQWSRVTGASGYEIHRLDSKSGKYALVNTVKKGSKTSHTNKLPKKKGTYRFRVRAYRNVGGRRAYSGYSGVKSVKVN